MKYVSEIVLAYSFYQWHYPENLQDGYDKDYYTVLKALKQFPYSLSIWPCNHCSFHLYYFRFGKVWLCTWPENKSKVHLTVSCLDFKDPIKNLCSHQYRADFATAFLVLLHLFCLNTTSLICWLHYPAGDLHNIIIITPMTYTPFRPSFDIHFLYD